MLEKKSDVDTCEKGEEPKEKKESIGRYKRLAYILRQLLVTFVEASYYYSSFVSIEKGCV